MRNIKGRANSGKQKKKLNTKMKEQERNKEEKDNNWIGYEERKNKEANGKKEGAV